MDVLARDLGFSKLILPGNGFELVAYRNATDDPGNRLHVYLEGDGVPWATRSQVSLDPTPRSPLALRLMALDAAPALYLARPCYNGKATAPDCNSWFWTSGRYSEVVIAAMEAALREMIEADGVDHLVLVGYSGGGVLAWHLAQRIPQVRGLVTVAANLDIDRWTSQHGYSHLTDSVNPAAGPPMRPGVGQWHFVGKADKNVPPEIIASIADKLGLEAHVLDSTHRCCWLRFWPGVLRRLP
jgi:pimeloyl-ACP methyl ester carboxylesterase